MKQLIYTSQEFAYDLLLKTDMERELSVKSLLDNKEKFTSIDIEKFISITKPIKQEPSLPLCYVETIYNKFQDSLEVVKSKLQNYLNSCQGNISLVIFDSIIGAQRHI